MQPTPIKRRSFLGYLLLLIALYRCRKDAIVTTKQTVTPPPVQTGVTDAYLGQYGATEVGSNLQPDPTYMAGFNGYTARQSYLPGNTVDLYLSDPTGKTTSITLKDARKNIILTLPAAIKAQKINSTKPWVEGFKYDKTISFELPVNLKSGVYTINDVIPVIVRGNNDVAYDLTVVYNSNTLNAYNFAGGKSLYAPDFDNRSTVVSFNRSTILVNAPFFYWLAGLGYNINYVADFDMDDYSQIKNSTAVLFSGHSEYWTRQARQNVDTFINAGKNIIMLSGNSMWWQVRYNKAQNLMICYKSLSGNSYENYTLDPLQSTIYSTINWGGNDTKYTILPTLGTDYRHGGYGQVLANRWNGFKIVNANSPLIKGSGLNNGDILSMPSTEYDGAPVVNLFAPGSTEIPVIDNTVMNFYKVELIGYDFAQNLTRKDQLGFGTFMICKRTSTSGTIINAASMDWCINFGQTNDKTALKAITKNMIDLSISGGNLFTT